VCGSLERGHKIENMFGRAEASTPDVTVAPHTYFTAICIAAAIAFWL
jgi:hypothetical protein